jgi:hypothetical protein
MPGCLSFAQAHPVDPVKATSTVSINMGNGYVVPGATWEHVTPESVGFSSARLEVLSAWLKTHPTTAMMAVYKGKIVFEYGDTSRVTKIASVRKSVLDMLFAAEGKNIKEDISNATVVQLGLQDKVPFVHPEELANFEQLISSRSGIYIPNGNTGQDATTPKRGSEYPGTHFFYNNWDFDALGTAFEKLTHRTSSTHCATTSPFPLACRTSIERAKKRTSHQSPFIPNMRCISQLATWQGSAC